MRRTELYASEACAGYIGIYHERRRWKRRWKRRILRSTAFLLAVLMGMTAVDYGVGKLVGRLRVNQQQEQDFLTATGVQPVLLPVTEMVAQAEEALVEEVLPGFPPGATLKEARELLVVLDPGHGGEDDGCVRDGVLEKEINLQIAKAVEAELEKMGYQVQMTRDTDKALGLEERVTMAQTAQADLYVSIHQNSSEVAKVSGTEVWYSAQNAGEESRRLSRLVQAGILENTGATRREILEEETLYVTRECAMASCLVEAGFLSNRAERQQLIDPGYQQQIATGIATGIDLYFHPKTMYLTFDDGPSKENTEKVLDTLKARNIKATFFLIGENVEKYPEVAQRIAAEGHTIGIHCNHHDYKKVYASVDAYLEDFSNAHKIIQEITGVDAKLFRFPGGSVNSYNRAVRQKIAAELESQGYVYYDWNASFEDAVKEPKAADILESAVSSTLGRRSVVMLGHDVVDETAECLDKLLDQFPEYRMAPLTEDVMPVQF
ncbi:MAG: polysaccharide deacetylase family protein [Lachnospiraceae bacterium]|nr:polysaccharide deacetylase family protein [Lachnospiraceae bacterium]